MLASIVDDFWTFGKWIPNGYNPPPSASAPGDVMQDIFGQPIAVGSMVKLIGVVTSLAPMDAHFQDVTFVPQYPQSFNVANTVGVPPQQQMLASVRCHPLQLMVVGKSL